MSDLLPAHYRLSTKSAILGDVRRSALPLRLLRLLTIFVVAAVPLSRAQIPQSDPKAVAIVMQASLALTGGTTVNDATLTGTATSIAGSTRETGTVTLIFAGLSFSRIDLQLDSGSSSEIRNNSGAPNGGVVDPKGNYHQLPLHNCFNPPAWFSPLGWVQAGLTTNAVLSYIGSETRGGVAVDHVRSYLGVDPTNPTANLQQKLSTFDLYLDASSHLPLAVEFNTHPYDDAGRDIPSEVRFNDYRLIGQVDTPFLIQKLSQGSLQLEIAVSGANTNSGVSPTQFQLQ